MSGAMAAGFQHGMAYDVARAGRELRDQGYTYQEGFLLPEQLGPLEAELKAMAEQHYNEANLERHAVYLSDRSPTRVSHAMMVAADHVLGEAVRDPGALPAVQMASAGLVRQLLEFHDQLLSHMTGVPVGRHSRSMLNFQEYMAGSKPVALHQDGEYLDHVKISPTQFRLLEGLLPRYVMVFTIRNDNVGEPNEGTVLQEIGTDCKINPPSRPGAVLVFDNVKFRHEVPELKRPRFMVGLRNFQHRPYYFSATNTEGNMRTLPGPGNPGFIKAVSSEEAEALLFQYSEQDWPIQWAKIKAEGAVF